MFRVFGKNIERSQATTLGIDDPIIDEFMEKNYKIHHAKVQKPIRKNLKEQAKFAGDYSAGIVFLTWTKMVFLTIIQTSLKINCTEERNHAFLTRLLLATVLW